MPINFVSPGAMAAQSIEDFLLQRAELERRAQLDALAQQEQEQGLQLRAQDLQLRRQQQAATDADRDAAREALAHEREFRQATTLSENAVPGDPVDAATYGVLQRQGYGGQVRRVPGVVQQGAQTDEIEGVPIYDVTTQPDTFQMRGGSRYLTAQATQEAAAERARETAEAAAERTRMTTEAAAERQREAERAADERARDRAALQTMLQSQGAEAAAERQRLHDERMAAQKGPKVSTGMQKKALSFHNRMQDALATTDEIEPQIAKQGMAGQLQGQYAWNILQTGTQQQYRQAQRAFTEARLRKESGAAVPTHEYENDAKTYFYQPGDSPEVTKQKAAKRQEVLEGVAFEAGPAYEEFYGEPFQRTGPAKTQSTGKTVTRAQLRAIAAKNGVSEAAAQQQAEAQGYTVQ